MSSGHLMRGDQFKRTARTYLLLIHLESKENTCNLTVITRAHFWVIIKFNVKKLLGRS